MICPYIIPVEKEISTQNTSGETSYRIIDAAKTTLAFGLTEKTADYIVRATNSHEKLKTFLETLKGKAQYAQIPNYVLRREIEQALKEGE